MRPVLKAGLRRLWRDSTTLQIGVDPQRAVILTDVGPADLSALNTLGSPGPELGPGGGEARDPTARTMIEILAQAGLIDDAADSGPAPVSDGDHDRFDPDLAALSLSSFGVRVPRSALHRRRRARVCVRGAGRIGAQIATLLAAAGVGQILVDDPGATSAADVAPGGLRLDDIGRPRSLAADTAVRRATSRRDPPCRQPTGRPMRSAKVEPLRPDLVLLAPVGLPVVHPDECLRLERAGVPHLLAGVRETTGIIGPLIVPGVTSCLHCQHLHRDARDSDWLILAMQMIRPPEHGADPCEISLATLVAAITAMQALDFLDLTTAASDRPRQLPTAADGTLEIARTDLRIRRRSWPLHPECPCRTARDAAGSPPQEQTISPEVLETAIDRQQLATGSTR
ncbi:thiamine biosynthesis protein ThiF [Frankia sp. CcI49]|uniref:ThiF family adenylyltransferase n=1 Tax=Frankia sp. CcI49 TaxID=1745382 RepID=UPI000975A9A3|nr:ThiF family adenylyltransferase [Frankia sp. CcI49]ONH53566.1 thiamine biosynthesis protein ThiF [Frankia sp. CcI49]